MGAAWSRRRPPFPASCLSPGVAPHRPVCPPATARGPGMGALRPVSGSSVAQREGMGGTKPRAGGLCTPPGSTLAARGHAALPGSREAASRCPGAEPPGFISVVSWKYVWVGKDTGFLSSGQFLLCPLNNQLLCHLQAAGRGGLRWMGRGGRATPRPMRTFVGLGGHLKGCLLPHRVSSKPCAVKTENRALTHKEDKMLVRHRSRDSVLGKNVLGTGGPPGPAVIPSPCPLLLPSLSAAGNET